MLVHILREVSDDFCSEALCVLRAVHWESPGQICFDFKLKVYIRVANLLSIAQNEKKISFSRLGYHRADDHMWPQRSAQ